MARTNDFIKSVDKIIGARIRELRITMGLSRVQLASRIDVTHQQLQKYEKGTNRIGASRLQHIARVLTVPVAFFFEDAPATPGDHSAGGVAEPERTSSSMARKLTITFTLSALPMPEKSLKLIFIDDFTRSVRLVIISSREIVFTTFI